MPVEIKELVIRATVSSSTSKAEREIVQDHENQLEIQNALVNECVKQVLNVLKRSQER